MANGRRGAGRWPAAGLIAAALLGAGCSDDAPQATEPTTTGGAPVAGTESEPAASPGDGAVELYFTRGEQFNKVSRELPEGGSVIEQAALALVAGPAKRERRRKVEAQTQIPAGVSVEEVSVSHDGTAVVEVSRDFLEGIPARAAERSDAEEAELNARLGQVTYTLTQFDRVEQAKVVAGGVAVEPALERSDYRPPSQGPQRKLRPKGERSSSTRQLQQRLANLGYLPPGAVDGVDGYRTQQAVIAFQSWEGLQRDGIVGPVTMAALADAKRPKPRRGGPHRRIEVYRAKGVALLVTHGKTRRAIHVSTGGPGNETPAGTFEVFRKELRSWSVPFSVWLPYASYFNQGIAFHEYPDVPTVPASHGCVRVPAPEAEVVYRFAQVGTVVVVI
jgi:lipoprotein-anchoring transpeptidase ErfK/SrfK